MSKNGMLGTVTHICSLHRFPVHAINVELLKKAVVINRHSTGIVGIVQA